MPRYNKREDFEAGLEVLGPFFDSLGYARTIADAFRDKEGDFYSASFTLLPRSVEVQHLYSLGPVIYRIGDFYIEHTPYLEALGMATSAHYPCYDDDSRAGYRALLHDLRTLLSPFFTSSQEEFSQIASPFMAKQRQRLVEDERRLAYGGALEDRLKAQARQLFFQKRYEEVVHIERQIRFPEFLTGPERYIFVQARKHVKK
jgi:hypothetical protein